MGRTDTMYSWLERPMVRFITIITIYLLGAITVIVIQMRNNPGLASALPLTFVFLPNGFIEGILWFFPNARFLFDQDRVDPRVVWIGFPIFIGLIAVIMRARSRVVLMLGYISFI